MKFLGKFKKPSCRILNVRREKENRQKFAILKFDHIFERLWIKFDEILNFFQP